MAKLLEVKNLQTQFLTSAGIVRAVDGVSYDVNEGETVALVGESGCGKSVSALSIMRLVAEPAGHIVGGEIVFKGRDLLKLTEEEMRDVRGRDIAMVFQEPMTSLNPVLTVGRQIGETLRVHQGLDRAAAEARAIDMLKLVGIPAPERRIRSLKWQQAVNTVEWVLARLPDTTQFQVYAFDTKTRPLVAGSAGRWLNVRDGRQTESALAALRTTAPTGGTSLHNAFAAIQQMQPAPDNVILVTDGLPTQGDKPPLVRTLVTMEQREDLMQDAVRSLPPGSPPVSVVLLPMEGDPSAPIFFWRLARSTGGGFLSPAKDWP